MYKYSNTERRGREKKKKVALKEIHMYRARIKSAPASSEACEMIFITSQMNNFALTVSGYWQD